MKRLTQRIKGYSNSKLFKSATVATSVMALMSMPVFAADEIDIQTVLQTSFSSVVADVLATIGVVLPIALGVLGLTVTVGFAVSWFKKIVGMAK